MIGMKRFIAPLVVLTAFVGMTWSSCEVIDDVLSDAEIAEGLKEALRVGTDTAVFHGSKLNGYFGYLLALALVEDVVKVIVKCFFIYRERARC